MHHSMPAKPTPPDQRGRPFKRGESGNPAGRPAGSRNKVLVALDKIGAEGAEEVLRRTVEAAKAGDMRAAELLLSRVWPARRGRPVALPGVPKIETPADLVRALGAVADSVAEGVISAEEGQAVAAVLEAQRKAIETSDLAERIARLEQGGNR